MPTDDEWPKILKWLSETMCLDHHHSVSSNRLEGTGQWLLQRKEFLDWRETTSPSILWLHGIGMDPVSVWGGRPRG